MTRKGHYLKRTGRGTTPGLVVSVVVNERTTHGEESDPRCRVRVFHSVNVSWSYHSRSGWTHPRDAKFGTTAAFWRWLDGLGQAGRRCYVFSPISSDALTLLRFWERVSVEGESESSGREREKVGRTANANGASAILRRFVSNGRPDIIGYSVAGCSFLWLSGRQFWDYSTRELADKLPDRSGDRGERESGGRPFDGRGSTAALVWLDAMTTFADWWASLGAGPFPRTVPTGAMQFFRSRMSPKSIVVHKDEEPYRLERAGCHGGRASCWYFGTVYAPKSKDRKLGKRPDGVSDGEIVGPVYRVDVRSMYPALLRDRLYPVSKLRYSELWDADDLLSLTKRYGVIADVDVVSECGEYPHRNGGLVTYPVGSFRSVLCGPELQSALDSGEVKRVWRAAAYHMGRPFATAAAELCELRNSYRDLGQTMWELLSKQLAVSLAGKLAQNPRGWQLVTDSSHYPRWDVWIDRNADTGVTRRFRCISGRVYEYKDIGVGQGTLTACFAFLTSYGRALMRSYREICPPFSVLSQDTDGLWVTQAGLDALRSACVLRDAAEVGQLELEERSSEGYWLGPKHYRVDSGWVLAGFHSPVPPRGMLVTDSYYVNPVRTGCTAPPSELRHFTRTSRLPKPPPSGHLSPDGWAAPIRFPELPGTVGPYHLPPPDEPPDP